MALTSRQLGTAQGDRNRDQHFGTPRGDAPEGADEQVLAHRGPAGEQAEPGGGYDGYLIYGCVGSVGSPSGANDGLASCGCWPTPV